MSIFLFFSFYRITDLHARHKRTLFCRELPLVPLSCPHSPLVSRSHMWHGGRGRLLRALLRRGIVWTSSSELSEVPSELSVSASVFAVGSSGTRGIGRIHSSSLDDSPLLLLANGFVFKAGRMSLTWRGVPSTSTACSLTDTVIAASAPANAIHRYRVRIKGIDARLPDRQGTRGPYELGDTVWVKPPNSRCTTRFRRGQITGIVSEQAVLAYQGTKGRTPPPIRTHLELCKTFLFVSKRKKR